MHLLYSCPNCDTIIRAETYLDAASLGLVRKRSIRTHCGACGDERERKIEDALIEAGRVDPHALAMLTDQC